MNANGSGLQRLTTDPAIDNLPTWSPDGARIAFNTNRDGNWEIYVMNADGSNPVNLSRNIGNDQMPDWSTDGTKIVFQSDRAGDMEVYTMSASDGSSVVRLTYNPGFDGQASWSPGDTKIALTRAGHIFTMNADGSGATRVTSIPNNQFPAWSQ